MKILMWTIISLVSFGAAQSTQTQLFQSTSLGFSLQIPSSMYFTIKNDTGFLGLFDGIGKGPACEMRLHGEQAAGIPADAAERYERLKDYDSANVGPRSGFFEWDKTRPGGFSRQTYVAGREAYESQMDFFNQLFFPIASEGDFWATHYRVTLYSNNAFLTLEFTCGSNTFKTHAPLLKKILSSFSLQR
jgi:hypothetical protein